MRKKIDIIRGVSDFTAKELPPKQLQAILVHIGNQLKSIKDNKQLPVPNHFPKNVENMRLSTFLGILTYYGISFEEFFKEINNVQE